jgi:hypothetical protein
MKERVEYVIRNVGMPVVYDHDLWSAAIKWSKAGLSRRVTWHYAITSGKPPPFTVNRVSKDDLAALVATWETQARDKGHNVSYGQWTMLDNNFPPAGSLSFTVGELLGDRYHKFDVPAVFSAYRDAVNAALPAGVTLDSSGHGFFGPPPVPFQVKRILVGAVRSVDFWAVAKQHRKAAPPRARRKGPK